MRNVPGRLTWFVFAAGLLLFSCQKPSESHVNWAFSADFTRLGLFQLLPDRSINLCDRNGSAGTVDAVMGALKAWGDTIGRSKRIKFQKTCQPESESALIDVYGGSTGGCGGDAIACAESRGRPLHFTISLGSRFEANHEAALHEAGHVWGNCDRYGAATLDAPTLGEGCDGKRGGGLTASAMQAVGANPQRGITADDVQGMRAMAADRNIAANVAWADIANAGEGSRNQSETNPNHNEIGDGPRQEQTGSDHRPDPKDDTSTEPDAEDGACDYSDADQYGGWGWNEATKQSCPPIQPHDQAGDWNSNQPVGGGECSYADADQYGGWGWNETTRKSCPPRNPFFLPWW